MTREELTRTAEQYVQATAANRIDASYALDQSMVGKHLFDTPILRFCSADDPWFEQLKEKQAIGPHFQGPNEWLPGADTVICLFFPIAEWICRENRRDMNWPSPSWLHARIEGQAMIGGAVSYLCEQLREAGGSVVAPSMDSRLLVCEGNISSIPKYSSNWSERHVAFVSGLGTFGLSKGLITERGVAGRFASVITDLHFPRDRRPYSELYEYCSMCGACAANCPAGAISLETGKDHQKCSTFVDRTKERHQPRYGCGKCQVGVPCETRPARGGDRETR